MRFMMLMIPAVYGPDAAPIEDADWAPPAEAVAAMSKYNDELANAGVLLSLDGLHPPARGARVAFAGGRPTVHDGPFSEAKEVVGGYWLIQAKSKEEAVEWASRCPAAEGDVVEVRQVFDADGMPEAVQEAAGL